MAGEWIDTVIGTQVTLQRGIDITRAEQRSGIVPVVSSGGVSSRHDTPAAKGPGVILGRKGVVGSVYYVESDYWPHDTTLWVKDFHGNHPRFVYYFFKWMSPRLTMMDVGSANPTLNRNHVHPMPIRWPSDHREQQAIACILGSLDDKIELNRRMNRTLEQMAAAIFKAWFVDFEPVKAKAAGAKSFPSMPQPVFDALPTTFADSPLGPIPMGWRCVPLPELVDVNPARSLQKGKTAPYLDMANMPTTGHAPEAWIDRPLGSGMRFINGDTLVARITPCLENGKTAFVDFLNEGQVGRGSTEYIVLRPKPPLPPVFAYCLGRSEDFRAFAIQRMTGSSGRQRVPADCLSQFLLAESSPLMAAAFGSLVEPLFGQARLNMMQTRTLAAIRDALLPRLLSGEIQVGAAANAVEGIA